MPGQGRQQLVHGARLVRHGQHQRGLVLARRRRLQGADDGKARAVVRVVLDMALDHAQLVLRARQFAGDRRHRAIFAGHAGRFGVRGHGVARDVRVILVQPHLALRQRLRMGADGRDAIHVAALRHQAVVHGDRHLAADDEASLQHHVQRAVDGAFRGILDRHDAEVRRPRLGGTEYFIDGRARQAFDGAAELLIHGLLAEGAGRAKIGHGNPFLQRAAGRHDFAEDGLHFAVAHGTGVALGHATQHLRLALGTEHGRLGLGLHVAHFLGDLRAAVQQLEDLRVDRIDLFAQRFQFIGHGWFVSSAVLQSLPRGLRRRRAGAHIHENAGQNDQG